MHTLLLLTAITMTLVALSTISRPIRFYLRILTSYLLLATFATYGVLASILLRLVGNATISQWATARAMKTIGCPTLGISFDLENEEHLSTRPAIFISNHQSELDILFLGRAFPKHCSVTAKRSLKYVPFLGWFMALSGTVFIDRANRKSAISTFDSAIQEIKGNRQSVWIFPEGTRSYFTEPDLLPFKKGAFHMAIQAGVPIVPVVVQNYSHVLNLKKRSFEAGVIKAKILKPIETTGLTNADVDELVKKTRDEMLAVLKGLTVEGKKDN